MHFSVLVQMTFPQAQIFLKWKAFCGNLNPYIWGKEHSGCLAIRPRTACTCVLVCVCKYVSLSSKWRKRLRLNVSYGSCRVGEYVIIFCGLVAVAVGSALFVELPPSEAGWCRVWNRAMPVGWTWQAPFPASFPNQPPSTALCAQPCCSYY